MERKQNQPNPSTSKGLIGAGILAAIGASLCCITPLLALIAGLSGAASAFSWLEPFRPYFAVITVMVLGFAWYRKLKPVKQASIDCACADEEKPSFWQSKKFLTGITVLAALMLTFPSYSGIFFPDNSISDTSIPNKENIAETRLNVEGMTCSGCEHSVDHTLQSAKGVVDASSSYKSGNAIVKFNQSKISPKKLAETVEEKTGYKTSVK